MGHEPPCLLDAWSAHEAELRGYLRHRLSDTQDADELLQDVFLKVDACQVRFDDAGKVCCFTPRPPQS
jgi:DNA-directed RNA polymerase specialized sigma24 family protein